MKHFISSLSVLCANTPPCEGRVSSRKILSLLLILFLGVGNAWAEVVTLSTNSTTVGKGTPVTDKFDYKLTFTSTTDAGTAYVQNAKSSSVYNTIAIPGTITSIELTDCATTSTKTDGSFKVYAGTDSGDGCIYEMGDITGLSSTKTNKIIDFSGNYSYFKIVVGSNRVLKISSIIITYTPSAGGGETPDPDPDPEEPDPNPGTGGDANTVTFTHKDLEGQGASNSGADFTGATKDPIFMGGKGRGNTSYVQIYANNYLTFTPTNATITKIVLTATSGYIKEWDASEGTIEISGDKATWTGSSTSTVTLTNTATAQARIIQMDVTYTASGSDESEAEIVKTLKSIAVTGMTTTFEQGDVFKFDGTCTATYSVTKDDVAQADQTAKVEPTSVSTPDMNQLGTQTVTVTYTEGEVTKTADYTITIEEAPTYNFTKIDMSEWGTGYNERVVTYEDATATFASASKQSGTITDQPVTKGGDVSLVLTDGMNIATVKWVCTQWTTKAQTITLHYSKDGGNVYTSTEITSSDFTISSDNLPAGTNAVKITFSSTDNQVGIKSCTITKVEAAAITQVPAPQFSLPEGAYDGAQSVELTCTMADATIHYTTDGTTPTTTSPVYSTAIQVTESMTIKAYAVKEGLEDSPMIEAVYEISAPADVVLDFTTNNWGLPSGSTNKATTEASYTDGTYTVSIAGTNGHYFDTNNLITGKKDAYIVLPVFNKPIVKIVCEGVSSGSGSVTFNVFVGDDAVSTAVTGCKVDQIFLIAEDKQVANVAHVIKVTNANNLRIAKIKIYLGEAPAVEKPIIGGEEEFVASTEVSITCATSGAKIYYTTDGTEPTNASAEYTAPFELTETKTVKAIAYVDGQASAVAEMTFTKQELVSVATAMALVKDEIAYFDEFEVVKVVAGKGNIYIKDASGHGLIYDNTLAGQLKDGDRVQGFVGISSPYNGLPEAKPYNVTYEDLTITAGTAAQPYDFTSTVIAEADINKYIVFQNVEITENTDMSTNPTLTIGGNSVKFYNQFGVSKTLEADKIYDIYGFVAVYEKDGNRTLQVYFYEAVQDGEVIQKYTVTYNAGGATGTVPVDNAEYSEGAEVYLKSATGLTYEGYEYKGWKVTDKDGNEISVAENKFNMPASNVTVTAQWEEIVVTPRQDFSAGYWVLVSSDGELTVGDKIMITAAEEDLAMKSYESGNNCQEIAITKLGEGKFVKWISEVGVFELAANGSNYTIQDVNTKDYLYAAGSGTNNYLKAADEVPTTEEEKAKYLWTISFTDGVPTVKATSENRNTLMYNTGSNLFACYASGQKAIALYKYVTSVEATKVTPSVVENAYFSVGNGEFVQFSTGNLQYEVGTNTWSFASEQYEVIGGEAYTGSNNTNYGMNEPGYTGKLDLFAWSCDGKFGVNPSNADDDYTGEFADWGNLVNETGWYTLTKDEMTYILNRKKDGKKLWALATVCGMNGLILLPDNWNTSTTLEYGYIPADWNYTKNQLDAAAWATLEAAGAVFLPEGGTRVGGHGNKDQGGGPAEFDAHGDYFHVDNVGEMGYYWLNSTTSEKADYLILPGWSDNGTPTDESDDKALAPQVWSREKRRGNSVRLVKEVTPDYTRAVTPGNLGTICLPFNVPAGKASGATFYTLAGMDANGRVAFDEVDVVTSELEAGKSYLFQATATEIVCFYGTTSVLTPDENGAMKGTFVNMTLTELTDIYYFAKNALWSCEGDTKLSVPANRAYVDMSRVSDLTEAASVGVRRITLGVNGQNTATGVDQVQGDEVPTKMIINGQLFILRGEKMYDAQGKLVK